MKFCIALATLLAALAWAGSAGAHEIRGGFSPGLSTNWFATDDEKSQDLLAAARADKPAKGSRGSNCRSGMAGEYACQNVDLLAHLSLAEIGAKTETAIGNDSWGWVDERRGRDREYAIVGRSDGTAFVEITNPHKPRFVADLPTQSDAGGDSWRDIKVYRDHAFIVSENTNHGMQVFDLDRLDDIRHWEQPKTVTADVVYTGISSTHNLDINTESGFAYLVGTNTCSNGTQHGGLHMVDIRNPKSPKFAGCALAEAPAAPINNYVHDSQCVNYRGPDRDYRGREICFGSNEEGVVIYDVTNKADPETISFTTYPTAVYTHQGWLTDDAKYFVFNDEGDENGFGSPPTVGMQTTYITSVKDLDDPGEVMASQNNTTSIDHNLYMPDDGFIYESNYTSGLRIFTESSVPSGDLREVAWFDVYPENDAATFEGGTWSNYSSYENDDVVTVSSIDRGLFVLETDLDRRR
jgi:choice-of-anchor B domain-containing protein